MECLFSYGTLQQKNVQLKNFGRILDGFKDVLQKYILKEIEITDESVLKISNKRFHPILFLPIMKRMKCAVPYSKLLRLNY